MLYIYLLYIVNIVCQLYLNKIEQKAQGSEEGRKVIHALILNNLPF